jgi:hypothetical protein
MDVGAETVLQLASESSGLQGLGEDDTAVGVVDGCVTDRQMLDPALYGRDADRLGGQAGSPHHPTTPQVSGRLHREAFFCKCFNCPTSKHGVIYALFCQTAVSVSRFR